MTATATRKMRPSRGYRIDPGTFGDATLPGAVVTVDDLRFEQVSPAFSALPAPVPPATGRFLPDVLPGLDPATVRAVRETGRPVRTPWVDLGARSWRFDLLPLVRNYDEPDAVLLLANPGPAQADPTAAEAEPARNGAAQGPIPVILAAGIGEWGIDLESGTVMRSEVMDRLFGFEDPAASITVPAFLDAIHPEDRPLVAAEIDRCRSEPALLDLDCRVPRMEGGEAWVTLRAESRLAAPGQPARLTGILMDSTRRKARQHDLAAALADREAALHRAQQQIAEIQHRVKNSLQLIASLLNLQGRTLGGGEGEVQFGEACRRVMTVAALYDRLYRTERVSSIEFGSYLASLCHDAERQAAMDGRECVVAADTVEAEVPTDKAIALALITNELIANALKHAYPDRQPCRVEVSLERMEDGGYRLGVSDRGRGLPKGFVPAKRKSLGMKLVTALARQIDGELEAMPQRPGTRFVLSFR